MILDGILARFNQEGFAPFLSETPAAAPFWGFNDVDSCPEASMEIKKEIRNFLNMKKFKAMEQYLDQEDEDEVQRHSFVI